MAADKKDKIDKEKT